MSISIATTSFNSENHGAQEAGNYNTGSYVFHNVEIFNEIKIGEQSFLAVYQAGHSYRNNDYSCPSNQISLSSDGGAHQALVDIWDAGDFDDSEEGDAEEFLASLKEDYSLELTLEDLRAVYQAIADNQNAAEQELNSMNLSDDIDDYMKDEETGLLELKEFTIEVIISGDSTGANTDEDNERFVDAVEEKLKKYYPYSTVSVEIDQTVSQSSNTVVGSNSDEDSERVDWIVREIWANADY